MTEAEEEFLKINKWLCTWNSFWAHSGRSAKLTPPPSKTVAVSGTLQRDRCCTKYYKIFLFTCRLSIPSSQRKSRAWPGRWSCLHTGLPSEPISIFFVFSVQPSKKTWYEALFARVIHINCGCGFRNIQAGLIKDQRFKLSVWLNSVWMTQEKFIVFRRRPTGLRFCNSFLRNWDICFITRQWAF